MKRTWFALVLAIGLTFLAATPAFACTSPMPAPGPGFGQCVAAMAHCCTAMGMTIGQCVRAMATGS